MLFRKASSHVVDRSLLSTRTLRTIKQHHRVSVGLPCHACHCKYFQATIGNCTNHHVHEALHGRWGGTPCRGRVLDRSRSPRWGARSRPHLACRNHIASLLPPPPLPTAPVVPAASAAPAGPAISIMGKRQSSNPASQQTSRALPVALAYDQRTAQGVV